MHILDASGFYAGVPFGSRLTYHTTPEVYGEVSHIKRGQGAIQALMDAGRLRVRSPDPEFVAAATRAATRTGDAPSLSAPDVSVLALAMQTGRHIITDDYSLSNVAAHLGIRVHPVMTRGIRAARTLTYACPVCGRDRRPGKTCPVCGAPLKRSVRRASAPSA